MTRLHKALYRWEFTLRGKQLKVDVEGAITLHHMGLVVKAAVAGIGIAYVVLTAACQAIAGGKLVEVLTEWTPPFFGTPLVLSEL